MRSEELLNDLAGLFVLSLVLAPSIALWLYASRRGCTAFASVDSPYPRRKRDVALGSAFKVAIIPALGQLAGIFGRTARQTQIDEETMWTCISVLTSAFLILVILPFCIAVQRSFHQASREYRTGEST